MSSLVKIQETTVTSSTASVTLTGIDSTFDVYKLVVNNLVPSADDAPMLRVTKSGTAQSDSNYDYAYKYLKADTSFANISGENATEVDIMATIDNSSSGGGNGVYYLFNFSNADEYSFVTVENAHFQASVDTVRGFAGSCIHTVASISDGVFISFNNDASGSTIETGHFVLYGIKK